MKPDQLNQILENMCSMKSADQLRNYYFQTFFDRGWAFHGAQIMCRSTREIQTVEKSVPHQMSNATISEYLSLSSRFNHRAEADSHFFEAESFILKVLGDHEDIEWILIFSVKPGVDRETILSLSIVFRRLYILLQEKTKYLKKLSQDSLTGLFCLDSFVRALGQEISRSKRAQNIFSILFFDLNRFKEVNTQLGHMNGNQFLSQFAMVLRQQFRKQDTIARFGGDEFVVLLPETSPYHATCVADRVEVEFNRFVSREHPDILSFGQKWTSFGVSSYPCDGTVVKKLLTTANKRMFQQKHESKYSSPSMGDSVNKDLNFGL